MLLISSCSIYNIIGVHLHVYVKYVYAYTCIYLYSHTYVHAHTYMYRLESSAYVLEAYVLEDKEL